MSWVEITSILGNFGEFVGAFAVVVTLIYLAAQVKLSKQLKFHLKESHSIVASGLSRKKQRTLGLIK